MFIGRSKWPFFTTNANRNATRPIEVGGYLMTGRSRATFMSADFFHLIDNKMIEATIHIFKNNSKSEDEVMSENTATITGALRTVMDLARILANISYPEVNLATHFLI